MARWKHWVRRPLTSCVDGHADAGDGRPDRHAQETRRLPGFDAAADPAITANAAMAGDHERRPQAGMNDIACQIDPPDLQRKLLRWSQTGCGACASGITPSQSAQPAQPVPAALPRTELPGCRRCRAIDGLDARLGLAQADSRAALLSPAAGQVPDRPGRVAGQLGAEPCRTPTGSRQSAWPHAQGVAAQIGALPLRDGAAAQQACRACARRPPPAASPGLKSRLNCCSPCRR